MPATCRHVEYLTTHKHNLEKHAEKELLKETRTKGLLQANKEYCYQNLKDAITKLINRPQFLEKCEQWWNRMVDKDVLFDIYDGKIWEEFQTVNGKPFYPSQTI